MAVHGSKPFIHVSDSNGNPIVGARLHVYEAGTTNYRAIWSDAGLSISLPNPLASANASDAAGNFPRFYMASGTYKLRAETAAGSLIWEWDNIDTALSAGAGALPVNAGGTGATTAAGARTNLDVPSNSELAALASDISALTSSIQAIIGQPQGRLTLTTGTPVLSGGVSAGTAVYYTPYTGTQIPIYGGTIFGVKTFAELTLTLNSNHVANAIYDVFVWEESGVVTVGTGPAWNTATAGAGARGSGAGTTELTRLSGIFVNANSMTTRNGATTYSVAANRATYVGSISMDGTNGQVSCNVDWGQSRRWGVWNAYNREKVILRVGDNTATWTYGVATIHQSNSAAGNTGQCFIGLPGHWLRTEFNQNVSSASSSAAPTIGIGENSTTAYAANCYLTIPAPGVAGSSFFVLAKYATIPTIGVNNYNMLETSVSVSTTFRGGPEDCMMIMEWTA